MTGGAQTSLALERLDLPRDGTVMVHGAFRAFARAGFAAEATLDALCARFEPGTLVLPTMSWRHVKPEAPFFDVLATPSNTGVLTELFRHRPGATRSLHPTHSCAAIGRGAEALTDGHHIGDTPCSADSPFGRLVAADGWVLLFGSAVDCCTVIHHVEEMVAPDIYLRPKDRVESYVCRAADGRERTVRLRRHLLLPRDYYQFQDMLAARGKLRLSRLASETLVAFRARDMDAVCREALRLQPDAVLARPGQRYRMM
jgi:aminoglycoside 3-N-acetyltransferase